MRKLVRFSVIVTHTDSYEFIELAMGKAVQGSMEIVPVRHGGEKANGELKQSPTAREFLLQYAATRSTFAWGEAREAGEAAGVTKAAVASMLTTLVKNKVLKKNAAGLYSAGKLPNGSADAAHAVEPGKPAAPYAPEPGTIKHAVVAFVRKHQNGSGEGVALATIKKGLKSKTEFVDAYLTDLVKRGALSRVGTGQYRAH